MRKHQPRFLCRGDNNSWIVALLFTKEINMAKHDVTAVMDTILATPGMEQTVKLTMKISRKNLLLLGKVIERGLHEKLSDTSINLILASLTADIRKDLLEINNDLLDKSGLTALQTKLKMLYESNA